MLNDAGKISVDAATPHSDALVADLSFTRMEHGNKRKNLALYGDSRRAALTLSLTLTSDSQSLEAAIRKIAKERRYFLFSCGPICADRERIRHSAAQKENELAIGFNVEGNVPRIGFVEPESLPNITESLLKLG